MYKTTPDAICISQFSTVIIYHHAVRTKQCRINQRQPFVYEGQHLVISRRVATLRKTMGQTQRENGRGSIFRRQCRLFIARYRRSPSISSCAMSGQPPFCQKERFEHFHVVMQAATKTFFLPLVAVNRSFDREYTAQCEKILQPNKKGQL